MDAMEKRSIKNHELDIRINEATDKAIHSFWLTIYHTFPEINIANSVDECPADIDSWDNFARGMVKKWYKENIEVDLTSDDWQEIAEGAGLESAHFLGGGLLGFYFETKSGELTIGDADGDLGYTLENSETQIFGQITDSVEFPTNEDRSEYVKALLKTFPKKGGV